MNATIVFSGMSLLAAILVAIFFIIAKDHGYDENSTFYGKVTVIDTREGEEADKPEVDGTAPFTVHFAQDGHKTAFAMFPDGTSQLLTYVLPKDMGHDFYVDAEADKGEIATDEDAEKDGKPVYYEHEEGEDYDFDERDEDEGEKEFYAFNFDAEGNLVNCEGEQNVEREQLKDFFGGVVGDVVVNGGEAPEGYTTARIQYELHKGKAPEDHFPGIPNLAACVEANENYAVDKERKLGVEDTLQEAKVDASFEALELDIAEQPEDGTDVDPHVYDEETDGHPNIMEEEDEFRDGLDIESRMLADRRLNTFHLPGGNMPAEYRSRFLGGLTTDEMRIPYASVPQRICASDRCNPICYEEVTDFCNTAQVDAEIAGCDEIVLEPEINERGEGFPMEMEGRNRRNDLRNKREKDQREARTKCKKQANKRREACNTQCRNKPSFESCKSQVNGFGTGYVKPKCFAMWEICSPLSDCSPHKLNRLPGENNCRHIAGEAERQACSDAYNKCRTHLYSVDPALKRRADWAGVRDPMKCRGELPKACFTTFAKDAVDLDGNRLTSSCTDKQARCTRMQKRAQLCIGKKGSRYHGGLTPELNHPMKRLLDNAAGVQVIAFVASNREKLADDMVQIWKYNGSTGRCYNSGQDQGSMGEMKPPGTPYTVRRKAHDIIDAYKQQRKGTPALPPISDVYCTVKVIYNSADNISGGIAGFLTGGILKWDKCQWKGVACVIQPKVPVMLKERVQWKPGASKNGQCQTQKVLAKDDVRDPSTGEAADLCMFIFNGTDDMGDWLTNFAGANFKKSNLGPVAKMFGAFGVNTGLGGHRMKVGPGCIGNSCAHRELGCESGVEGADGKCCDYGGKDPRTNLCYNGRDTAYIVHGGFGDLIRRLVEQKSDRPTGPTWHHPKPANNGLKVYREKGGLEARVNKCKHMWNANKQVLAQPGYQQRVDACEANCKASYMNDLRCGVTHTAGACIRQCQQLPYLGAGPPVFVGHSQGAAMATIAWNYFGRDPDSPLIVFGAPRVYKKKHTTTTTTTESGYTPRVWVPPVAAVREWIPGRPAVYQWFWMCNWYWTWEWYQVGRWQRNRECTGQWIWHHTGWHWKPRRRRWVWQYGYWEWKVTCSWQWRWVTTWQQRRVRKQHCFWDHRMTQRATSGYWITVTPRKAGYWTGGKRWSRQTTKQNTKVVAPPCKAEHNRWYHESDPVASSIAGSMDDFTHAQLGMEIQRVCPDKGWLWGCKGAYTYRRQKTSCTKNPPKALAGLPAFLRSLPQFGNGFKLGGLYALKGITGFLGRNGGGGLLTNKIIGGPMQDVRSLANHMPNLPCFLFGKQEYAAQHNIVNYQFAYEDTWNPNRCDENNVVAWIGYLAQAFLGLEPMNGIAGIVNVVIGITCLFLFFC